MSAPSAPSASGADAFVPSVLAPVSGTKRSHPSSASDGLSNGLRPAQRSSDADADADNIDLSFARLGGIAAMPASPAKAIGLVIDQTQTRTSAAASSPSFSTAAPPTRWSSLYADALHSIFQFASLLELTRLMSVSERWGVAVLSMPPIASSAIIRNRDHLTRMLSSRACRHVSCLYSEPDGGRPASYSIETVAELQLLSVQLPWLRELDVASHKLGQADELCSALSRFDQLRRLNLVIPTGPISASNRIVEAIGGLHSAPLHDLDLNFPRNSSEFSFAPLCALKQMRIFRFVFRDASAVLSDAQMTQLRCFSSLQELTRPDLAVRENTDFLVRLLQPGHSLLLTSLGGLIRVSDALAPLLGSLPSLTCLAAGLRCADVRFLSQLRALTSVELMGSAPDAAELAAALRPCTQITRLELSGFALTSRHLEDLLPAFPLLSDLHLDSLRQLGSLRCLSASALASSLTKLTLWNLPMCPPTEIVHLFGLRSLRELFIHGLSSPLSADQKSELAFRPERFPALTRYKIR